MKVAVVFTVSPPRDIVILFNMFLNFIGKKCQLTVFFSLYFLGKTGHSYKEVLNFPHVVEPHAGGTVITPLGLRG